MSVSYTHLDVYKRQDTNITVDISDEGEGMTEEVKKHIFEKFYQGDSSRKSEGNGLGLALVKRIVVLCHGAVTVESAPGQGATCLLYTSRCV